MSILDDVTGAINDIDADKLKQIVAIIGAAVTLGTLAMKAIEAMKRDDALDEVTDEVLAVAAELSRTMAAVTRAQLLPSTDA